MTEAIAEAPVKVKKAKKAKPEAVPVEEAMYHLMDPKLIQVIEGSQSRFTDHTEEDVATICNSIKAGERIVPITVRKVGDDYVLGTGHRRLAAFLKWNEENPEKQKKVPAFIEEDMDDEQAFVHDIRTNVHAKAYTPVDLWRISQKMEDEHQWKGNKIARLLGKHNSYISQLKKLNECSEKTVTLVHEEKLALNAAFALAKAVPDKEEQDDVIERATALTKPKKDEGQGEGWIDSNAVAKAIRDHLDAKKPAEEAGEDDDSETSEGETEAKEEKPAPETTPYPKMNLAQFKEWLEGKRDGPGEKPSIRKIGDVLFKLIMGQLALERVDKQLDKLFKDEKASNE